MLKKYIKADTLEVVEKLTDKYEYLIFLLSTDKEIRSFRTFIVCGQ